MIRESQIERGDQNSHQNEWDDLIDAILGNKRFNEAKNCINASLMTSMRTKTKVMRMTKS